MANSSSEVSTDLSHLSKTADGNLIGLLTVGAYGLFTLLPSSHSLMVSWPWVAVWQITLALPMIWLLWQFWFKPIKQFRLGSGLDWPIVVFVLGLGVSTAFAQFPNQARWYAWAALGGIAAVYALAGWLKTSKQALLLLQCQAVLGIVFILESLGLWLFQTYWPELARLATLEPYGVAQSFNFNITSLRNWYPLGHQNYVAGYLVLILPLLFGLGITTKGWPRWVWLIGCCVGLADLYTASSRGGLVALVLTVAIALVIAILRSQLPRRIVLPAGGLLLCLLVIVTLSNSRVRRPILALLQGKTQNSELGYRMITNLIGWHMGVDHPLTGIGLGNVLQLYQKYRPYWAGREAELHFQLHSTPAQLWAELGILGITALVSLAVMLGWLTWRWASRPHATVLQPSLVWSLAAGLFAYGLMGLTDYQLDIPAISGVILVYIVVLAKVYQSESSNSNHHPEHFHPKHLKTSRWFVGLGLGCFIAVNLWLVPVHRAWALSKKGFEQLNRGNFDSFEQMLTQAHRLAPWEPYYSSMLAWALGDFGFQTTGETSNTLKARAVEWFQTANTLAPYQEFGQSNLGWLLFNTDPDAAVAAFAQASYLVPAKQGVFYGLGISLLANDRPNLAIEAMVAEMLRYPILITSPIWQSSELAPWRERVFDRLEQQYSEFLRTEESILTPYWKQLRGTLYWWQNNYDAARQDWQDFPTGQTLLRLDSDPTLMADTLPDNVIGRSAMLAWLLPEQRRSLLEQAALSLDNQLPLLNTTALPSPEFIQQLVTIMEQANSFEDWLKNNGLIAQPRNQRLGFGALSRHIDGPSPLDYYTRVTNQPIEQYFAGVLPPLHFQPELDEQLHVLHQQIRAELTP